MELSIGEVIYKLRKEKGVTQENLANAVGVSVAAVSKWESKSSYPDITILPSIARYFNTTIDNLLNYEMKISNEEVMKLMKECARVFEKDSAENGMKLCESYIRKYPNSMFLKFRVGSLYMMSLPSAKNEEESEIMVDKAINLLEISSNSEEQEISETSKYVLSTLYTMKNQYDKAEEVLLSLPKVNMDRDDLLIGLYINQNKYEKAKTTLRNLTYKRISNIMTCLDSYITLAYKDDDYLKVKEILDLKIKVAKTFDVEELYDVSINMMYADIYAKENNIEKTLDYIESILNNVSYLINGYDLKEHILFDGIELFEGVHSKDYFLLSLKRLLIEDERYNFIKNEERYKEIVKKLEQIK